jgi:thymidylate synthase (FAD)
MEIVNASFKIESAINTDRILANLEQYGRTAYKSEDAITTDSSKGFIQRILKSGHESVIEHEHLTVRFICDRGVTHEIVRHRLVAYTQESTRYCNYARKGIQFIKPCFWDEGSGAYICWFLAMKDAESRYNWLISSGCSPQQARSVLPNSLKTEIVCTANLREWRHILKLRTAKAAHPQMREIMVPLLKAFQAQLPVIFDDIHPEE